MRSLGSQVFEIKRLPSVFRVDRVSPLRGPNVSKTSGMNMCVAVSWWYFSFFNEAACSAAAPADVAHDVTYDVATMSRQVTSHAKQRPAVQGMTVAPFGLREEPGIRPVDYYYYYY